MKTAEIWITKTIRDSIIDNWISAEITEQSPEILDSEAKLHHESFKVVLRIPYKFRSGNVHMLIKSDLSFSLIKNRNILSISCNILKPIVIFTAIGFFTSVLFILPYFHFPLINLVYPIIAGLIISGIYFSIFYLKIKRFSEQYIAELVKAVQ